MGSCLWLYAGIIRARATVYLHVSSLNAQPWLAWPRSLGVVHSNRLQFVSSVCIVWSGETEWVQLSHGYRKLLHKRDLCEIKPTRCFLFVEITAPVLCLRSLVL